MPGVQVLDALTGKPVEGASVDASMRYSIDRSVHTLSPTDRYGRINLRKSYNRFFPYTDGDRSYPVVSAYTYKQDQVDLSKKNERKYIVSTDRAIYRPGQKVHFFGQCDRIGYAVEDARAIGGSEVEVVLEDANSKEIGRLLCQADEMERFSDSRADCRVAAHQRDLHLAQSVWRSACGAGVRRQDSLDRKSVV